MADLTTITQEGAFDGTVRTQINANFTALNSGGGGESILHQATVTLDNDQIQAIGDGGTDVEILSAPGAGKALVLVSGFATLDSTAGAYSGVHASSGIVLAYGVFFASPISAQLAAALGLAGTQDILFSAFTGGVGAGAFAGFLVDTAGIAVNRNLNITDWWAPGAYGDGNAANTMIVSVAYLVLDTTTGLFE